MTEDQLMRAFGLGAATEDEILEGLSDAMTLAGWRWVHIRRSDLALVQGMTGFPDLFAVHPTYGGLALEVKAARGRESAEQAAWIILLRAAGIPAAIVYPNDYDLCLELILGKRGAPDEWRTISGTPRRTGADHPEP